MNTIDALANLASQVKFSYETLPSPDTRFGEKEYLNHYDVTKYGLSEDSVVHTADACVFALPDRQDAPVQVLMIKRGNHPYKSYWCLPGGFVDLSDDTVSDAAQRELAEETGVENLDTPTYVGSYNHPWRDPRMEKIISNCFLFTTHNPSLTVKGMDDATEAIWVPVSEVLEGHFFIGFDHILLVKDAVIKLAEQHKNNPQQ